jgi:REP element-mobilizing transposase RayT
MYAHSTEWMVNPQKQGGKMANTMVKNYMHLIFHIKSTSVQMQQGDLPRIFAYIGGIIKELGGIPFIVGGMPDHVHLLITLPKNMTLVDLARITKAKSSRWIKTISSDYCTFAWQDGYGAFSVSPSILEKTVDYIKNQERHHQKKSYQDEYKAFLEAYKIPYDEKYIFND